MTRGIALLCLGPRHSRLGWRVRPTPRPPLPPGKIRYPLYRRLGGPQGRSGQAENVIPTEIRSRTFQPIVRSYTDWATRPTSVIVIWQIQTCGSRKFFARLMQIGFSLREKSHKEHLRHRLTLVFIRLLPILELYSNVQKRLCVFTMLLSVRCQPYFPIIL